MEFLAKEWSGADNNGNRTLFFAPRPLHASSRSMQMAALPANALTQTHAISDTIFPPKLTQGSYDLYVPVVMQPNPLSAVNPHPEDATTGQSPNAYLQWQTLQPDNTALHYDLYLEANNPDPQQKIAANLATPSFDPVTFSVDTQYYWRVVVIDQQGQSVAGPVWTFRVESFQDPPAVGTSILIPAGTFWMGCDRKVDTCFNNNFHHESPLRQVYVDAYEIDKYEVTNQEYLNCVKSKACRPPFSFGAPRRTAYFNNPTYANYPVLYVSWSDGQAYCRWVGKRLPTEAEWEKADRGPIDTRPWPWGQETATCDRANYRLNCLGVTTRVGSYPASASPYGVMDLAGNAFEWVQDQYVVNYYDFAPNENPQGPTYSRTDLNFTQRSLWPIYTLRGGSYTDNWWYSRVAYRHFGHRGWTGRGNSDKPGRDAPAYRNHRAGFRCARSVVN
jgi:formylglycine-generating enzyme required for sulfatase activity